MATIETIPVSDLLLDESNARLPDPQPTTQQATAVAMARLDPQRLVTLAEHIAANGMDPTTLPAVVATSDSRKRYRVMEGNRRVLALKALETPSLVLGVLNAAQQKALTRAAARFETDPIDTIQCVLFENAKAPVLWISLRHSGPAGGAGLAVWGSEEKDRFNERHSLDRQAQHAREIVDFLDNIGALGTRDRLEQRRILSNVRRLFSTPEVRLRLGIEANTSGGVVSNFTAGETARVLGPIVRRFVDGTLPVSQIYHATDRRAFAAALSGDDLPDSAQRISTPTRLSELPSRPSAAARKSGKATDSDSDGKTTKGSKDTAKRRKAEPRTTLIPRSCQLDIAPPRINAISLELQDLSIEKAPNACSVLFRVLIELSVDHYIAAHKVMTEVKMNKTQFGQKLKEVADHLRQAGLIPEGLRKVIDTVGNGRGPLASSFTMNQYVHNAHIIVNPRELRDAWDEIQPFMEKVWP